MKKIMTKKDATAHMHLASERRKKQRVLKYVYLYSDSEKQEAKTALLEIEKAIKAPTATADVALSEVQKRCTAGIFKDADEILTAATAAVEKWAALFPAKILAGSVIEIAARRITCKAYTRKGTPAATWAKLVIDKSGALVITEIWRGDATHQSSFTPSPACAEWILNTKHYL